MKILLYCINFAPEQIGVGKYTGEMAAWLARFGHDMHVVTAPPYYPAWKIDTGYRAWRYSREEWQGCSVWRCPLWVPARPRGLTRILHLISFALSSLPVLAGQIGWRPDIVFVVEPPFFCAPGALLFARLTGARAWLHVQDFEVAAYFGLDFGRTRLLQRFLVSMEGWLMRRFDRVTTISQSMLERIRRLGVSEADTSVFPNWIDARLMDTDPSDGDLRRAWNLTDSQKVVLYAGNMGMKQGLDMVLRVAQMLLLSRPDIRFLMIGDGADRENLKGKVRNLGLSNVIFKPFQPIQSLPSLLNLAHVHLVVQRRGAADAVMPSKLTGILAAGGAALITADAATELGRLIERHPGIAVRVEPENPDALLSAITSLIDDDDKRRMCGSIARRYAREHLCTDGILSEFETLACQMLATDPNKS